MHFTKLDFNNYKDNPNHGLFFQKFAPHFIDARKGSDKRKFLESVISLQKSGSAFTKRINALKQYCGYEKSHINESDGRTPLYLKNIKKLLCGVGYINTTDWGLGFDWTVGLPYLPGSSLKGTLLSYLEFCANDPAPVKDWKNGNKAVLVENIDEWDKNEIIRVFGEQNEKEPAKSGEVVFMNVYPEKFNGYKIDVITPHYTKYYENPKIPPADIYNPVPTHFLTVAPGSEFAFLYGFRNSYNKCLDDKIKRLIIETGKNYGFGAKTSSDYGYFVPDIIRIAENNQKKTEISKKKDQQIPHDLASQLAKVAKN